MLSGKFETLFEPGGVVAQTSLYKMRRSRTSPQEKADKTSLNLIDLFTLLARGERLIKNLIQR